MRTVTIRSFAKINLSLDVMPRREDGFHEVDMIMQQLDFCDDVKVEFQQEEPSDGEPGTAHNNVHAEDPGAESAERHGIQISLSPCSEELPADSGNLAYRAAALMAERYGSQICGGHVRIEITKRIPIAAGLAGGSGNAAAVVHALNLLWDLGLSLQEICNVCAELGSDVPFSAIGQAAANPVMPEALRNDPLAAVCARATGRGTILKPVRGIDAPVIIAKPPLAVSTAEVYRGFDQCEVLHRPDTDAFEADLNAGWSGSFREFINVLELYTLQAYPEVAALKQALTEQGVRFCLMSGSGPTVFAIPESEETAKTIISAISRQGYTAYQTRTLLQ